MRDGHHWKKIGPSGPGIKQKENTTDFESAYDLSCLDVVQVMHVIANCYTCTLVKN